MTTITARLLLIACAISVSSSAFASSGEPVKQPQNPDLVTDTIPAEPGSAHDSLQPRLPEVVPTPVQPVPVQHLPREAAQPKEWESQLHYFELMYRGVQIGSGSSTVR